MRWELVRDSMSKVKYRRCDYFSYVLVSTQPNVVGRRVRDHGAIELRACK